VCLCLSVCVVCVFAQGSVRTLLCVCSTVETLTAFALLPPSSQYCSRQCLFYRRAASLLTTTRYECGGDCVEGIYECISCVHRSHSSHHFTTPTLIHTIHTRTYTHTNTRTHKHTHTRTHTHTQKCISPASCPSPYTHAGKQQQQQQQQQRKKQ
jgi:hypothetical protein